MPSLSSSAAAAAAIVAEDVRFMVAIPCFFCFVLFHGGTLGRWKTKNVDVVTFNADDHDDEANLVSWWRTVRYMCLSLSHQPPIRPSFPPPIIHRGWLAAPFDCSMAFQVCSSRAIVTCWSYFFLAIFPHTQQQQKCSKNCRLHFGTLRPISVSVAAAAAAAAVPESQLWLFVVQVTPKFLQSQETLTGRLF